MDTRKQFFGRLYSEAGRLYRRWVTAFQGARAGVVDVGDLGEFTIVAEGGAAILVRHCPRCGEHSRVGEVADAPGAVELAREALRLGDGPLCRAVRVGGFSGVSADVLRLYAFGEDVYVARTPGEAAEGWLRDSGEHVDPADIVEIGETMEGL